MSRIQPSTQNLSRTERKVEHASGQERSSIDSNAARTLALSPTASLGFEQLSAQVSRSIDGQLRESIALLVSQMTDCQYCLSEHTYRFNQRFPWLGGGMEVYLNRLGQSTGEVTETALKFVKKAIESNGKVPKVEFDHMHAVGFTEQQIVDILSAVAHSLFVSLVTNVADTEIDFPLVPARLQ